jgi:DNA ligase-1
MPQLITRTCLPRRRLLGALAAWGASSALPGSAWAARPALPLVLAQNAPDDLDPSGYLVSEKYDGVRGYWDGRQLWFRSGLPVAAPGWFTAALPAVPLDGELWMARGRFEALVGAVRRAQPLDSEWRGIRFMVFERPVAEGSFAERAAAIRALLAAHPAGPAVAVAQDSLPDRAALLKRLDAVVAGGGEGLVLHRADAAFVAGRSPAVLKLKPLADAEAQVIGHVEGRGRLQGRLGALRVRTVDGTVFLIGTGLSDALRDQPPPVGAWVTFTHRGLTERGVPRFASYLRLRQV